MILESNLILPQDFLGWEDRSNLQVMLVDYTKRQVLLDFDMQLFPVATFSNRFEPVLAIGLFEVLLIGQSDPR